VRKDTAIPIDPFDGHRLPYGDGEFDAVTFVDVLHHTDDPAELLGEAARVSRSVIVLKDHLLNGSLAQPTLAFMDWVGNARHGVVLPNNYWPENRWREAFDRLGLRITAWAVELGIYPWPAALLFGRQLHFIARLEKA
jgi:SAM-dependent methyltransferase